MEIFQTPEEQKQEVLRLSEERESRLERGRLSKEFLNSEFLGKFLLPFIETERLGSYPDPTDDDWQNRYIVAYSRDKVYSNFLSTVQSWSKEAETITSEDEQPEKKIV